MPVKTQNNFRHNGISHSRNSGFGRMLLVSLGLHLLVFLVFGNNSFFPRVAPRQNIYHVDLLTLPAPKPPGPVVSKPEPTVVEPAPPVVKPAPPVVAPVAVKVPPKVVAPVVKPVAPPPVAKKSVVKPTPTIPVVVPPETVQPSKSDLNSVAARIETMQRQQVQNEIEALKNKVLQQSAAFDTPVTPTASGSSDQVGAAIEAKIKAYLTENWMLSAYQIKGDEGPATFTVTFNTAGELVDFKLKTGSGSVIFDQSARNAILRSKKLPFLLEEAQEFEVVFDPEELKKKKL